MTPTLSFYIARRIISAIVAAYIILFTLIFLIDFVEQLQNLGRNDEATLFDVAVLTVQRVPYIAEEVLPFTVLFGAIAAFVSLSRKMELVIARASGVSIWQMVAPAVLTAALVGVFATLVHNPLSSAMQENAARIQTDVFRKGSSGGGQKWFRQTSNDDQSIFKAADSTDRGRTLIGLTAFVFSPDGALLERVEASRAVFHEGYWDLASARVVRVGQPPESHESYHIQTNLTAEQIAESISRPERMSFWELPGIIAQWRMSGIRTERFELRYQSLMSRPASYATMVLIAACVSLGFSRFGGVLKAILGGVLAGFVLYVASQMAGDLGATGFITPVVAAWAPPVIGALLSVTVLLHQEDG